jgi:triosephosphate isomerase
VLEQREQGVTFEVVGMQTKIALQGVSADELKKITLLTNPFGLSARAKPLPQTRLTRLTAISARLMQTFTARTLLMLSLFSTAVQ